LLKFFVLGMMCFYIWKYSTTGRRYDFLSSLQGFLLAVSEMAFFISLYLISKGWRILYSGIPTREMRSTMIAMVILLFSLIFFSIYNPDYYWLSLVLMYFLMLPKIFTSISQNIRLLETQITLFQQTQAIPIEPYLTLVVEKQKMYLRLRNALLMYLLAILMINTLMKILLAWDYLWVSKLCEELVVLVMVIFVMFSIWPEKRIFFTSFEEMRPFLNLVDFLQRRGDLALEQMRHRQKPWDVTKTIAVQWPVRKKRRNAVTRLDLSLAYEEKYDYEQREIDL